MNRARAFTTKPGDLVWEPDHDGAGLAGTITAQLVDLGWQDAWRTELRGPHGEWIRSPGEIPAERGDRHGALRDLVEGHLRAHPGAAFTAYQIGKELGRSSGAVTNALETLVHLGVAEHAGDHPRTYRLKHATAPHPAPPPPPKPAPAAHPAPARKPAARHPRTPAGAVTAFAEKASTVVPSLLGGGQENWNGKVKLFNAEDQPGVAAALDWDGRMEFQRELAQHMLDDLHGTDDDPINSAIPYVDALHELIHGLLPAGQTPRMQMDGYRNPAGASIEEGFTELGAIHHAPEFFTRMGIGDRPTSMLAGNSMDPAWEKEARSLAADIEAHAKTLGADPRPPWQQAARRLHDLAARIQADPWNLKDQNFSDRLTYLSDEHGALFDAQHLGDPALAEWAIAARRQGAGLQRRPASRRATLAEYAAQLRDPDRIANGDAWRHYGWQTAAAQAWVTSAAQAQLGGAYPYDPRVRALARTLADEINREGAGGKLAAMVRQVIRAAGADPDKYHGERFAHLVKQIQATWPADPASARDSHAWAVAMSTVRQYEREHRTDLAREAGLPDPGVGAGRPGPAGDGGASAGGRAGPAAAGRPGAGTGAAGGAGRGHDAGPASRHRHHLISAQALELGWRDAWLHEGRNARGEWTRGGPVGTSASVNIPREEHGYEGKFAGRDTFIPSLKPAAGVETLTSRGRPDGAGTPDDPIDVQGNIDRAILLMAQGKHVRLNQVDEVATLMVKVNQLAGDYERHGRKMPNWDMGKISVAGTNLFTTQTKGIPRILMPQLSGPAQPGTRAAEAAGGAGKFVDLAGQFRAQLAREGIPVTDEMVPTSHLRATQKELTASSVAGIAGAALQGNPKVTAMLREPLWVTRDNYIIDGHHRWAAQMMLDALDGVLGNDTVTEVHRVGMDIGAMIPYANQFARDWGIAAEGLGQHGGKLVQTAGTISAQVDLGAAPGWPWPEVATVHALVAALGAAGQPIGQQEQAVREFMDTAAWGSAPPVLRRDVARWLGLLAEAGLAGDDPALALAAPVPDDKTAVAMFTAHRTGDALTELGHAAEQMKAARAASGDLRAYHSRQVHRHLAAALDAAHDLTGHLRQHYPAEAAELEQVKTHIGLARAVSPAAKAATTAHLLETTLHEMTHGIRHAQAMVDDPAPDGAEWQFNADHAAKHLGGAAEHAGKLAEHFRDNYTAEAKWLPRTAAAGEGGKPPQHARYAKAGGKQLAGTISAQVLDLSRRDAWLHEGRDARGRWAKDAAPPAPPAADAAEPPPPPEHELMGNALWNSPNGVPDTISPAEADAAARVWYSDSAILTNKLMRGQYASGSPPADFTADEESFAGLINRSRPFTEPALMYHGADDGSVLFGPPGTAAGKRFTDRGFVSLTAKYDTAQQYGDTMVKVHVPPGIHALRADQGIWAKAGNPSYYTTDGIREYTLPPGSRFRVDKDTPGMPGVPRTLDVTVLPPEPGPHGPSGPHPGSVEPIVTANDPGVPDLPGGERFAWRPGDVDFGDDETAQAHAGGGIAAQVADLSWRDAWRTELRGPHGEWVRGGETASLQMKPGDIIRKLPSVPGAGNRAMENLRRAADALDAGDQEEAAFQLREAAKYARMHGYGNAANAWERLADEVRPGSSEDSKAVHDFMNKADDVVPRMFGPQEKLDWDGRPPTVFPDDEHPEFIAEIDWHGHVMINQTAASGIRAGLEGTGPVENPDAFTVPLHELIHVVLPPGQNRISNGDQQAYQQAAGRKIEEGFTQLATAHHAAEFFTKLGIGGRPTEIAAKDADGNAIDNPAFAAAVSKFAGELETQQAKIAADGRPPYTTAARHLGLLAGRLRQDPWNVKMESFDDDFSGPLSEIQHLGDPDLARWAMSMRARGGEIAAMPSDLHYTMAEWAQQMASPDRIKGGTSWPHYTDWTADAYNWVADIARRMSNGREDPALVRKLADQVSAVGTAAKPRVMADQVIVAAGLLHQDPALSKDQLDAARKSAGDAILASWGKMAPEAAAERAAGAFRNTVASLRATAMKEAA